MYYYGCEGLESMKYENNEQVVIELKKAMLESKTTQKAVAEKLGIQPQGLTKLLNKKNFGFDDANKILDAIGYELDFEVKHTK